MAGTTSAVTQKKLELRSKALEANKAEIPHMEVPLEKVKTVLTEMRNLTVEQASLTAKKQEVTKRLTELNSEGQKLMTFVDAGIREHYGNRSEKLVEFGQRPFRSQPRIKLIEVVVGKPVTPVPAPANSPAPPRNE